MGIRGRTCSYNEHRLRREVSRHGSGPAAIVPLLGYTPDLGFEDLPDPWYTGDFEATYRLVERAVDNLLAEIRAEHGV